MLHIALFGGSFDPVHLGHIKVAETVLNQVPIDQVWFVPAAVHPEKESTMFSFEQRTEFLKKIVHRNPRFHVCEFDVCESGKSYTIYLIRALLALYKNHKFSFIIGADNVMKLKSWHEYQELLQYIDFLVIDRDVSDKNEWKNLHYYDKLSFVSMERVDISSSTIRDRINKKEDYASLVPIEIIEMIDKKKEG